MTLRLSEHLSCLREESFLEAAASTNGNHPDKLELIF